MFGSQIGKCSVVGLNSVVGIADIMRFPLRGGVAENCLKTGGKIIKVTDLENIGKYCDTNFMQRGYIVNEIDFPENGKSA